MRTLLFVCLFAITITAGAQNTAPLPSGNTTIGNHLTVGAGNEVWTSANELFFNYRGSAEKTHFWNTGGPSGNTIMTLLKSGNVGIGTTTPSSRLSVNGGLSIDGVNSIASVNGFNNSIQLINPSHAAIVYNPGQPTELMFGMHSNGAFYWGAGCNSSGGSKYLMSLSKEGRLSGLETLYLNAGVYVGGNGLDARLGCNDLQFNRAENTSYISNIGANGSLSFTTSGGSDKVRMVITGNGNVGIGTNSPTAGLHVSTYFNSNNTKIAAILGVEYNSWTNFGGLTAGRIRGSNEGYLCIGSNPNGTGDKNLYLNSDSPGNVLIAGGGGNVGIGIAALGKCKLAVEGTIGAREVVVTANAWPDYVFNHDYKLRSLEEIEQYVNTEKHLPDVPSADAVAKDGVSLGEMNAILLRKVEELTLHLIELKKEVDQLHQENVAIKNVVKAQ